jgi:ribosomal protein L36
MKADKFAVDIIATLLVSMKPETPWYKNCKSVRRRGGVICKSCPFRRLIETAERKVKP